MRSSTTTTRCWDGIVVVLKGLGSPTAMALTAFRNREAARAVDGGADYRAVNALGLGQPDRGEHRGVMSMQWVNWSRTWVSG